VLKDDNFQASSIISDFMEVINSGKVQGVCIWAPAGELVTPIAEACEANHVYFTLSDKVPADVKDSLMGMEYFAGAVGPANEVYGKDAADYAIAQGWKTCVVTTSAEGDTSDQPRYDAFKEAFEANGGTIVTTVNNDSTDVSLENVRNALNGLDAAPDFIYGVGSSYALTAITALDDHADWSTKVITSGLEDDVIKLLVK
jgi:ABC-type sugar transport system substrate-binding protein